VVSFAGVDDVTRAYINDSGSVNADGNLTLTAKDSTGIISIAGLRLQRSGHDHRGLHQRD